MTTDKIARFVAERRGQTPFLVVDLEEVERNYSTFRRALPDARIFYAVKANPAPEILALLAGLGACFDAASVREIELVLAAGAGPERISYGNTIKKEADIARAHALGVRLFAFDSDAELDKLARAAPGASVFCRILTSGEGADWPLSRKFGCAPAMAERLLLRARALGLDAMGISFHVGSQQANPEAWNEALASAALLFRRLSDQGVTLRLVNLGGGFPARYLKAVPTAEAYGRSILDALRTHFGNRIPETIIEPGRGLVGDAGVIASEVVLVSRKSDAPGESRWVYLDIGKFGGLAETMDEAIRYPLVTARDGEAIGPCVLAGPTCDSADVLYERTPYDLPISLDVGDLVLILSAGAYTTTYASVDFNGFAPLETYCV